MSCRHTVSLQGLMLIQDNLSIHVIVAYKTIKRSTLLNSLKTIKLYDSTRKTG